MGAGGGLDTGRVGCIPAWLQIFEGDSRPLRTREREEDSKVTPSMTTSWVEDGTCVDLETGRDRCWATLCWLIAPVELVSDVEWGLQRRTHL